MDVTGKIHAIETSGMVDGPGIRYVVFTQGCPLRCAYCHNPDTWEQSGKNFKEVTVSELIPDMLKYKSYFKYSGGGVTLTGGEPLLQKEFCAALFKECKRKGLHTALDTSGYASIDDATKEVLKYTDLVLLDIKSISPVTYKKVTGVPIYKTLEFAKFLQSQNITTWVCFVLVPGLTDNPEELRELAYFLTTLNNIEMVRILPFHQLGAYKWQNLDVRYTLKDTPTPTVEEAERVRDMFRQHGFDTR